MRHGEDHMATFPDIIDRETLQVPLHAIFQTWASICVECNEAIQLAYRSCLTFKSLNHSSLWIDKDNGKNGYDITSMIYWIRYELTIRKSLYKKFCINIEWWLYVKVRESDLFTLRIYFCFSFISFNIMTRKHTCI